MKTIKGIYYDLNESEYIYNLDQFEFRFSSKFYLNKFKNELEKYINYETARIKQKFNIYVDMSYLLYLALYLKIEKRGFCVRYLNKLLDKDNVKMCVNLIEG